jgi:hypothetical protein
LGLRCVEGVCLDPATRSHYYPFRGFWRNRRNIFGFGPLKKPMFAEDLERNKISALNRNILAMYIGDNFSEYWRSFGYVWRQKKDQFWRYILANICLIKGGPKSLSPQICPQIYIPNFFSLLISTALYPLQPGPPLTLTPP